MSQPCTLCLDEKEGVVNVYAGSEFIGVLERDGDMKFNLRGPVKVTSLDLFLLAKRSEELRSTEIKRLQGILESLRAGREVA